MKFFSLRTIKKEIIQLLYDKGLFDSYPNKDQVFEPYLIFTDEYLLNKYGKEIKINNDRRLIQTKGLILFIRFRLSYKQRKYYNRIN